MSDYFGQRGYKNPSQDSGYFLKDPAAQFMIDNSNFIDSSGNLSDEDYQVASNDMKRMQLE